MNGLDRWSSLEYIPDPPPAPDPNLLWFDSDVCPDDVLEASEHQPQYVYSVDGKKRIKPGFKRTTIGIKVEMNGKAVAIFKHRGCLYAMDNSCPHQGGSLYLGDIEDYDGTTCVSCPRHRWPFSLRDGTCQLGFALQAECYPVKIETGKHGRDVIFVGFRGLTPSLFSSDTF